MRFHLILLTLVSMSLFQCSGHNLAVKNESVPPSELTSFEKKPSGEKNPAESPVLSGQNAENTIQRRLKDLHQLSLQEYKKQIDKKNDTSKKDEKGWGLLHHAVREKRLDLLNWILEQKLDEGSPSTEDYRDESLFVPRGSTPLDMAKLNENRPAMALLEKHLPKKRLGKVLKDGTSLFQDLSLTSAVISTLNADLEVEIEQIIAGGPFKYGILQKTTEIKLAHIQITLETGQALTITHQNEGQYLVRHMLRDHYHSFFIEKNRVQIVPGFVRIKTPKGLSGWVLTRELHIPGLELQEEDLPTLEPETVEKPVKAPALPYTGQRKCEYSYLRFF